jgi:hypothetical protein
LPASRQVLQPAQLEIHPGETYDFEFTPAKPGRLRLEATLSFFHKLAVVPLDVH